MVTIRRRDTREKTTERRKKATIMMRRAVIVRQFTTKSVNRVLADGGNALNMQAISVLQW